MKATVRIFATALLALLFGTAAWSWNNQAEINRASDLAPLFTSTTVDTPTGKVATYTASTAAAHTFYGNETGSTALPHFVGVTAGDLPATVVLTTGSQTIAGQKTFTLAPILTSATIQANGDVLTIEDWGNANFILSEGTQTINGAKIFSTPPGIGSGGLPSSSIASGSAKRELIRVQLSPAVGAAADTTVYRALIGFGRAGTVTHITYGTGVDPVSGTNVLSFEKNGFAGNTLLSTATVSLNGVTANTAVAGTLTATGADLVMTASDTIGCEYNAGTQGTDAEQVYATVEFQPDDF